MLWFQTRMVLLPYKDPEKIKQYHKQYYVEGRITDKETQPFRSFMKLVERRYGQYRKVWNKKMQERNNLNGNTKRRWEEWYNKTGKIRNKTLVYKIRKNENYRKNRIKKKLMVFNHYSDYDIKCNCCGEKRIQFITLDHINNNGAKQKKELGRDGIYRWVIKNNFPSEFQLLCMNCNFSKGLDKEHICIHKKETNDCIFDYQVIA